MVYSLIYLHYLLFHSEAVRLFPGTHVFPKNVPTVYATFPGLTFGKRGSFMCSYLNLRHVFGSFLMEAEQSPLHPCNTETQPVVLGEQ